ncbi:MAG: RNA polymerase sigma factor [Candidatus Eisenbacteria bacterium]
MAKGFVETSKRRNGSYFGAGAKTPSLPPQGSKQRHAEESRLISSAQAGDAAALRRLLSIVSRPAFRYGMTFCRDREDAEEIAQDVLSSLVRSLARYRGDGTLSTWAFSVARNACIRHRRRSRRAVASLDAWRAEKGAEPADHDPDADPQGRLERREIREAVAAALRLLPASLREAVVLRDVEGLSAREAATVLRITERALKSRLHRARLELRTRLQPLVTGEEVSPRSRRCPDIARSWSLHLEGEVSAAVCARLENHVRACPECAAACRTMRATIRHCRLLRAKRLPLEAKKALAVIVSASRTSSAAKGWK